ncbi:glutaredoxin family protein [Rubrivirga sp.]|uniref:glutaredoxin family protein n=1 Tax=Rubrivirga sp. TaxID=1885344 RepID=UPI003C78CF4E
MTRALFALAFLVGCQTAPPEESEPVAALEVATPEPLPADADEAALEDDAADGGVSAVRPEVVVYVTSWCPYCRQAREYLAAEEIPHRVVDIEASEAGAQEYAARGGTGGIPLVVVGDEAIEGWSAQATDELLTAAGYN